MYTLISICALLIFASITNAHSQDCNHCRQILEEGVRDQYEGVETKSLATAFMNALLMSSDKLHTEDGATSIGINVPLAEAILGIEGSQNNQAMTRMRSQYSNHSASSLSADDYVWMLKRVVNPDITLAWTNCINGCQSMVGLVGEFLEVSDGNYVISVKWNGRLGVNQATISDVYVSANAEIKQDNIQKGTVVGSEWIKCAIARKDTGLVVVVINTESNIGSYLATSAPTEQPKSVEPATMTSMDSCEAGFASVCRRLCMEMNPNSCEKMSQIISDSCRQMQREFGNHSFYSQQQSSMVLNCDRLVQIWHDKNLLAQQLIEMKMQGKANTFEYQRELDRFKIDPERPVPGFPRF